jgi:hypothetical protein
VNPVEKVVVVVEPTLFDEHGVAAGEAAANGDDALLVPLEVDRGRDRVRVTFNWRRGLFGNVDGPRIIVGELGSTLEQPFLLLSESRYHVILEGIDVVLPSLYSSHFQAIFDGLVKGAISHPLSGGLISLGLIRGRGRFLAFYEITRFNFARISKSGRKWPQGVAAGPEVVLDRLDTFLLSGSLARAFNVPQGAGLLIQGVADNSPTHNMGLEPSMIPVKIGREKILIGSDIVLEVQGIPISTDLENVCQNCYARATVAICDCVTYREVRCDLFKTVRSPAWRDEMKSLWHGNRLWVNGMG